MLIPELWIDEAKRTTVELGFTWCGIRSRDRHPSTVKARRAVAFRLRELGASTVQIGRILRRDHSTIVVLLETCERRERRLFRQKMNACGVQT